MKILNELSYLNPHMDETSILPFDEPGAVQVSRSPTCASPAAGS